jgi:hypothetical protein
MTAGSAAMEATAEEQDRATDPPVLPRRRGWDDARFAPLMLHVPLVVLAVFSYWLTDDPAFTLYISGALTFITYLALAVLEARRAPLWLSPLLFYFLWYAIELGLAAIHYGSKISDGEIIRFSVKVIYPDDLAAGYLVFLTGSCALHAGMQWMRPLPERHEEPRPEPAMSGFLILWVLGIFVRFFAHLAGGFGAIVGIVYWGSLAALCAFALTRGSGPRRTTSFWLILTAGTLIEFATQLRAGSKAYLMFSFLPALWLFSRERSLRRLLPAFGVGLALLYFTVIAPVVSASRLDAQSEGETPGDRIVRTYTQGSYDEGESLAEQAGAFFERGFEPTPVAFLYSEVERAGLRYGETMDYLAYAFIPRLFWEDKPGVSRGAWFNYYLGAVRTEREAMTSTSVGQTACGELYWNFGVAGVVLGLGFIGTILGMLWRLATPHPERDPVRLLLYISITFSMIDMSEAGSTIVGITYRAVVLAPAILLLDRVARQGARA